MVRVRFAPSPTGVLHVGGVRTALFNWLFARHNKGVFILRMDDTDAVRSRDEHIKNIQESLKWLGLDWDEGPLFQSERLDRYREVGEKLLKEGKAFRCYCTAEELEAKRQAAARQKRAPRYDGTCLDLSDEQEAKFVAQGRKPAVRFRLPEGPAIVLDDLIRGKMTFPRDMLDHFILLRSDGKPVYNFTCAVDEMDHQITHVIRGDDHISNTPKQMLVAQACGFPLPKYAHLPQILGLDRARLSKRRGAPGVLELREEGYLKEAVINFLVLLGWSFNEKDEIFSLDELVEKFDLARVGSSPAVFDEQKLLWMNGLYIRNADPAVIDREIGWRLAEAHPKGLGEDADYVARVSALLRESLKTLNEAVPAGGFFFEKDPEWDQAAKDKLGKWPRAGEILEQVEAIVSSAEPFTPDELEKRFRAGAEGAGLKFKDYVHPTRFATTHRTAGPSLFHLLEVLGRERCLDRIRAARKLLPAP